MASDLAEVQLVHSKLALVLLVAITGCQDIEDTPDASETTDTNVQQRDDSVASPDTSSTVDTRTPDATQSDLATTTDVGSTADTGADLATAPDMAMNTPDMGICPDQYEPNNVVADATAVTSGMTISAANCGFDDDDVYAINLTAGQTITLTHSFMNAGGNLDLNLHAPSQAADVGKTGSYAAITFSFDDVETITHVAAESGTYYILSFNNNETQNAYTLSIDVQ